MDRQTDKQEPTCLESQNVLDYLRQISDAMLRIADHIDPPPPDKIGTPYVAERLCCTTDYVAIMAREGVIGQSCVVPGTANGKPWKFYRSRIDEWIEKR